MPHISHRGSTKPRVLRGISITFVAISFLIFSIFVLTAPTEAFLRNLTLTADPFLLPAELVARPDLRREEVRTESGSSSDIDFLKPSTNDTSSFEPPPPAPAATVSFDFDGDSKADIGRWHGSNTEFKVRNSSGGLYSTATIGSASSRPAPFDFDGDGMTDAVVFNAGTWNIKQSSNGAAAAIRVLGRRVTFRFRAIGSAVRRRMRRFTGLRREAGIFATRLAER